MNKRDLKKNNKNDLERKLGPGIYKYKSHIGLGSKYAIGKKLKIKIKIVNNKGSNFSKAESGNKKNKSKN